MNSCYNSSNCNAKGGGNTIELRRSADPPRMIVACNDVMTNLNVSTGSGDNVSKKRKQSKEKDEDPKNKKKQPTLWTLT